MRGEVKELGVRKAQHDVKQFGKHWMLRGRGNRKAGGVN